MTTHYRYDKSLPRTQRKKFNRRRLILAIIIVIILGAVGFATWKIYKDLQNQNAINSKESNSSSVAAMQVYRSPYFEFQDSGGSWELDKNSTDSKFAYYKHKDNVVQHELLIYVNSVPSNLDASRGLPVVIKNSTAFEPGTVTEHCHSVYGANEPMRQRVVTMSGAAFPCVPDTSQFSVYVTKIGGNQILQLRRVNGSSIQFVIYYRDLRAVPDGKTITGIVATFHTI
jgi:type II secretory pathway pseudopilin PulG